MKLKGEINLSSTCVVEISSACGKLKIIDLLKDNGSINGNCWLEAGEAYDWDNVNYLHEAFKSLESKDKMNAAYKGLKRYLKENGLSFKDYKQELLVMFRDAEKLGMFNQVLTNVKVEQDQF